MNIKQIELNFCRNLIKGKIAEVIFEQMMREEKKYTIIPFGYEHTMPMLAQYQHLVEVKHVIKNISDAPDFALISEDKSKLFLVEIKYQTRLDINDIVMYSKKLLDKWEYPWLFVVTLGGFYCGMTDWIIKENSINELSDNWVTKERQIEYLKLLKEFEKEIYH
jgi:hypothetical protein